MSLSVRKKSQRSLRTILIVWFLLFAIVPLAFLTGFSVIRYEKAIDKELGNRLEGNAREVATTLGEFHNSLVQKRDRHFSDPAFIYNLSTNQVDDLAEVAKSWIHNDITTEISFFSRNGRMLLSVVRAGDNVKEVTPPTNNGVYVSDENLAKLKDDNEYLFIDVNEGRKMSLILLSRVENSTSKVVGYVEQLIELNQSFLNSIKNRMRVQLVLIRKNAQILVSTHPDFYDYKKDFFTNYIQPNSPANFELYLRGDPHEFIMYPMHWGKSDFFIAIGASKADAKAVLRGVNYAFYTVVATVSLLLVVTILLISNSILRPLDDLVKAAQDLPLSDQMVEIPIKSDTEIGLLTESFNQMSRQILRARSELKANIKELESANLELKEAQSRLVHSSKMSSLGQLVAGVAHELNNPISFIYSNMTHLKEYSSNLLQLADASDLGPEKIQELKEKFDIEYIKKDLPKLVASCEDGARRVRDIVLGLRNFSRLDEAKIIDVDLNQALDSTLNLLSGEIKNRIQIHRNYGQLPLASCYATQINQVFMNVLSNAVQAIEGPGNIWIATKKTGSGLGKEKIIVSIQDSGKGISPEHIDRIFDPFFSTKGVGEGTGLGLSISYGIIQSHGGEIQAKSQLGIGTEFVISLPVKKTESSESI